MFDVPLELYKIFCLVVRAGNISHAAKELYLTQPAVSMAIRQLEEKLGKELLVRTSKGVKPTIEGEVLFQYIDQALNLIDTAEKKYTDFVNMKMGEVRIGANDTIISHYLMPVIERYVSEYPNVNINVTNRTSGETLKLLRNGNVDLGFINLPIPSDKSLIVTECMEITDCLIGGSKFNHLTDGIKLNEINDYPLLMLEKGTIIRKSLDDYASKHGHIFSPNIELGSIDLLLAFCKINLGLTFSIKEFIQAEMNSGAIYEIPLMPQIPPRKIGMVRQKGISLSIAAENFIKLLKEETV
jgi:DNA-binding transcriptional LysR family regulator